MSIKPTSRMVLCAGLQSGGTTLLSWCFLQRADTDGVLDMPNDVLQVDFERVAAPVLWVKMTVGAFRWLDVEQIYRDLGYAPEPLLVVRDVRAVFASLLRKRWGRNGTTGEEPPLRLRFRRFLRDWHLFRERGWPIVRYEDLVLGGEATLRALCDRLGLPWDGAMTAWPKTLDAIAYPNREGNESFLRSVARGSFEAAVQPDRLTLRLDHVPQAELDWLDATFAEYNAAHGYPPEAPPAEARPDTMPPPQFEGTMRHWWVTEHEHLWAEIGRLGGLSDAP